METQLLGLKEAGPKLGICRNNILKLIKTDPSFPYVMVGNRYKINMALATEYLNDATKKNKKL